MRHDPTFWILARASGLTAYVMLTLSVLAGIAVKSRPFGKAVRPAAATDTHRTLALLGLGALAIHATALVLDKTVHTPVWALFLPFTSTYRPLAVGLGVLAAEVMVLVYLSFSVRTWIGAKVWRRLHWAAYAVFLGATLHGLMAGTDTARPWTFALYLAAVGSVATATVWRALVARPDAARASGSRRVDPGLTGRSPDVSEIGSFHHAGT